jgi:spore coat polysaccharide biosynthesis protein SpsF
MRRNARVASFPAPSFGPSGAATRVTIDTLEDYLVVRRLFEGITDPVGARWDDLARRAVALQQPVLDRFVLGTAQIGLAYGIANLVGCPTDADAQTLIESAYAAGIRTFDTARAYGTAEQRLGTGLAGRSSARIVTKLDPLAELTPQATAGEVERAVDASIYRSVHELRRRTLEVVLLHRWAHRAAWDGAVWQRLLELRADGAIGALGASVSTTDEAHAALADPDVTHLQLPLNALDRRWEDVGRRARERGITVHVRSSFLQGLLVAPAGRWPAIPGVASDALVAQLDRCAQTLGRDGRDDLALAYVRAKRWVDGIVVGVDSPHQLDRNVRLFATPPLDAAGVAELEAAFPDLPVTLLDPARWPVAR